ncbi:MAG: hypothetical protein J6Y48_18750 [Clostridia bacterium]|nr:hypothetical protein [Clostridia bacterium]
MDNAYYLFEAMNDFRKAQIASRGNYLQKKQQLDQFKGSAAYDTYLKKLRDERDTVNAAARATCKAKIEPIFKAMHEANAKRGITAPSEEAIRILTAVQMLKKPSKTFLDCVANSLGGNSLALAVLDQIARDAWKDEMDISNRVVPNYSTGRAAKELDPGITAEAINNLQKTCNKILSGSGANRSRETSADLAKLRYGAQYDPDELPQEPEYASQQDFYDRELSNVYSNNRGMTIIPYALFVEAVNGA